MIEISYIRILHEFSAPSIRGPAEVKNFCLLPSTSRVL